MCLTELDSNKLLVLLSEIIKKATSSRRGEASCYNAPVTCLLPN
jgi:hypothetical protein